MLTTKLDNITAGVLHSSDLALFATIVGKVNMFGCLCYWCNLSTNEWSDKSHTKGML